jgi:hypothetical protein
MSDVALRGGTYNRGIGSYTELFDSHPDLGGRIIKSDYIGADYGEQSEPTIRKRYTEADDYYIDNDDDNLRRNYYAPSEKFEKSDGTVKENYNRPGYVDSNTFKKLTITNLRKGRKIENLPAMLKVPTLASDSDEINKTVSYYF